MVKALVDISDEANQVLNIVKAKFGLKDKSEAINVMAKQYEDSILEPQLRPEYKKELLKLDKGRFKRFSSVEELRKEIEKVK